MVVSERRQQPSPAQVRAGRALLNWNQQQLADHSGIARRTVAAYEHGGNRVTTSSITAMAEALGRAGINFSGDGDPEGVYRLSD